MIKFKNFWKVGFGIAAVMLLCGTGVDAQKECGATGSTQSEITIKNELKFDIEIRFLKPDCSEDRGSTVGAKREIKVGGFEGHTYRIYENWTDRVLTEVKFKSGQLIYPVKGFEASAIDAKKKRCSRDGDPRPMLIRNATGRLIDVRFVDKDCREQKGPVIAPGKQAGARSFVNNVFRAYDLASGSFISEFAIRPTQRNYVIGGVADPLPEQSFLKTVNAFRAYYKIEPLRLNDTLTETCRWFADFMATQDKMHAGHLASEFTPSSKFRNMNTPTQRLLSFGWKRSKAADNIEVTAAVRVEDKDLIGGYLAMEWSSSTTHFKPFYDLYRTRYAQVGFAAVASKSDPDLYYGCAMFAND